MASPQIGDDMLSAGRMSMTPKLIIPPKTYINGQPWREQYTNVSQVGALGTFTADSTIALPIARQGNAAVVTKNLVYLLGGGVVATQPTSVYATINSSGIIVGPWSTGPALPVNVTGGTVHAVMIGNKVYLIGNAASTSAVTYWCTVNPDGTLDGNWQTGTSLPLLAAPAGVFITKNRIFAVCGGTNTLTQTKNVYTAPIAPDGTIGTWSTSTAILDTARSLTHTLVADGKYAYIMAGYQSSSGTGLCTRAPINSDGTLGAWVVHSAIPSGFYTYQAMAVIVNGMVHLIGGSNNLAQRNTNTASVDANGLAGAWTTTVGTTPVLLNNGSVIVTSSRVYLLGCNGQLNAYYAGFAGGSNDYTDKTYV